MGKRAQRIPSWPGVIHSNKGRIHLRRPTSDILAFRLRRSGGPYIPSTPFFIPCVLKRSDTLTKCKKDPQLDLRAGLLQRFYSVCPPWPSRFCFIGWARVSGEREPLGGAFST